MYVLRLAPGRHWATGKWHYSRQTSKYKSMAHPTGWWRGWYLGNIHHCLYTTSPRCHHQTATMMRKDRKGQLCISWCYIQYKHGTVHTARKMVQNKSIYTFKAQTEKMETTLTAIASERRAWAFYHSYCSLEHSVTLGACAECQLPPCKLESLPQPFLNVTNLPRPLIHMPSLQLFLIPVHIVNPWSYRRWTCHMTPCSGPLPVSATVCPAWPYFMSQSPALEAYREIYAF